MQYRSDQMGKQLSVLGLGCMRFPRKHGSVDQQAVNQQVRFAVEQGINYFDTAYIYPGSEEALGLALETLDCRDQINIATKLPHYLVKKPGDMEKYFSEQLRRLRTDHVDYYLMHMLPDTATWERMCRLGVEDWLEEKKQSGQIRQVGFSYHGNTLEFQKLLEVYPWNFCQVQYNYVDERTQAGRAGVEKAASLGIPIVIMEPLRGGRLVDGLPQEAKDTFARANPQRGPADWGLRWLWNQEAITVVLSGMNSMEMFRENCRVASEVQINALTETELQVYEQVKGIITAKIKVGCTGCAYCMPCPKGVDIPGTFRCYNALYNEGTYTALKEYYMCTALRRNTALASQCVKCGRCEQHCPQGIHIREELDNAVKALETPVFKAANLIAGLFRRE